MNDLTVEQQLCGHKQLLAVFERFSRSARFPAFEEWQRGAVIHFIKHLDRFGPSTTERALKDYERCPFSRGSGMLVRSLSTGHVIRRAGITTSSSPRSHCGLRTIWQLCEWVTPDDAVKALSECTV